MLRVLGLCLLLFTFPLCASPSPIRERLENAKSGDYIVAEANKMITLLSIRSKTPTSLVLEEISIPLQNLKERPLSWSQWVKARAPGHTSWSMIELDPCTGQLIECYSFSRASWICASERESLFATLLQLPVVPIELSARKRIGPPPLEGADHRQIWEPPLFFEGEKRGNAHFDAFQATWPQDGTELSEKTISLYFDRNVHFPFPFWIQVDSSHASATFRVIDSGRNLPSLYRSMPRRTPEFLGQPKRTQGTFRLSLKSPKYYRCFELFAVDVTHREKQILPITYSLLEEKGELLTLEITEEHLQRVLEPEHRYTWLLVPQGHHESYTETIHPFTWIKR